MRLSSTPAFCNGASWACWKPARIIPRGGERLETVGAGGGAGCAPSSLRSISGWSWPWRTSLTLLKPSQAWRAAQPLWQVDLRPEERGATEVPARRATLPDEPTKCTQPPARSTGALTPPLSGKLQVAPDAGPSEGRERRRAGCWSRASLPQMGASPEGACDPVVRARASSPRGSHRQGEGLHT